MKTWNMPVVTEVEISETNYGGEPSEKLDNSYFDQNGALHVNFEPNTNPQS